MPKTVYIEARGETAMFPDEATPEQIQDAIQRTYFATPPSGFLGGVVTGARQSVASTLSAFGQVAESLLPTTSAAIDQGTAPPGGLERLARFVAPSPTAVLAAGKTLPSKAGRIMGQVAGMLPEFVAGGVATKPAIAALKLGPKAATIAHSAATFGAVGGLHEGPAGILPGAATGAAFGLANIPASRALRGLLSSGLGGGLAAAGGADTEDTAISAALFGALGAMGRTRADFAKEAAKTPDAPVADVLKRLEGPPKRLSLPAPSQTAALPPPGPGRAFGEDFSMRSGAPSGPKQLPAPSWPPQSRTPGVVEGEYTVVPDVQPGRREFRPETQPARLPAPLKRLTAEHPVYGEGFTAGEPFTPKGGSMLPGAKEFRPRSREAPDVLLKNSRVLDLIDADLKAGQPGSRVFTRPEGPGGTEVTAAPSTYPVYFINKGYAAKEISGSIDRVRSGQPITDRQRAMLDDLIDGKRTSLTEEAKGIRAEQMAFDEGSLARERPATTWTPSSLATAMERGEITPITRAEADTLPHGRTFRIGGADVTGQEGWYRYTAKEPAAPRYPLPRGGRATPPPGGQSAKGFLPGRGTVGREQHRPGQTPLRDEGDVTIGFFGAGAVPAPIKRGLKALGASRPGTLFRSFWQPMSTIPNSEALLTARNEAGGRAWKAEQIIRAHYNKLSKLPPAQREAVMYAVTNLGNRRTLAELALTPEAKAAVGEVRRLNTRIGQELVNRGLITAEQFKAHESDYVRYSYLRHLVPENVPIPVSSSGRMDLSYAKARMNDRDFPYEAKKALGIIDDISVAQPLGLQRSLSDIVKFDLLSTYRSHPGATWQPSIVTVRDLPATFPSQRSAAYFAKQRGVQNGRIVQDTSPDAGERWKVLDAMGKPIGQQFSIQELVKETRIAERIRDAAPGNREAAARATALVDALDAAKRTVKQVPKDFIAVPDTKAWGPLRGLYVHKDIYHDLTPLFGEWFASARQTSHAIDLAVRTYTTGLGGFKMAKVALNLPTIARATIGNPILLNMSGIRMDKIPALYGRTAKALYDKAPIVKEAREHGVFNANWSQTEIRELIGALEPFKAQGWAKLPQFIKIAAKQYGKIDDFSKLAKFIEQRERGVPIDTAVREAHKWIMDYSLVHPAVKAARMTAVPFASFSYKIAPLVAESLANRPWTILKLAAIPFATIEAAKLLQPMTPEEERKMMTDLPLYIKHSESYAVVPWKVDGKWTWFDLQYFFPWGSWQKAAFDTIKGQPGEVVRDLGLGNPFTTISSALKGWRENKVAVDPFTGQEIFSRLDTNKPLRFAEWLLNQWLPPMIALGTQHAGGGPFGPGSAAGYTYDAVSGAKDRYGRETTPTKALLRWFGVNLVTPTPQQTQAQRAREEMEIRRALIRKLTDPQVPPEEKAAAKKEAMRQMNAMKQPKPLFGVSP